jgi:hypothetical protein
MYIILTYTVISGSVFLHIPFLCKNKNNLFHRIFTCNVHTYNYDFFIIFTRNASQEFFHKTPHIYPNIYTFNNYPYIIFVTVIYMCMYVCMYVLYVGKRGGYKASSPDLKYKGPVMLNQNCRNITI